MIDSINRFSFRPFAYAPARYFPGVITIDRFCMFWIFNMRKIIEWVIILALQRLPYYRHLLWALAGAMLWPLVSGLIKPVFRALRKRAVHALRRYEPYISLGFILIGCMAWIRHWMRPYRIR